MARHSDYSLGAHGSYGGLARGLNCPRAARAVGAAVGRNPLSVIIPCHRVLGTGSKLTGYAGGLERKQALLALERVAAGGEIDPDDVDERERGWQHEHGAK